MVSSNTNDVPPKRTFLIVLSILGIGALAYSAHSLIPSSAPSILVKDDAVIASDISPESVGGTVESITASDDKPVITTYTVRGGDTISSIASKFGISSNTLLWANDLTKKSTIKEGQKLTILPVSGVMYTVGKGDTLGGIANKFDADMDEVIAFNDLEDTKTITLGMKLIIPNGELPLSKEGAREAPKAAEKTIAKAPKIVAVAQEKEEVQAKKEEAKTQPQPTAAIDTAEKTVVETDPTSKGYFTMPIPGAILTQGTHGYNGIDFGAPVGTKVYAAAAGKVIVAKPEGYNGGYGKYVVIEHENGTQTLYGHLSKVVVSVDDEVTKGENIGLSGNTGKSTGPHLHFEVRGGTNPWSAFKKLSQF